jgi:hypothetical protein
MRHALPVTGGRQGWYVIVTDGESYAIHSVSGDRDDAIASACRFLKQGRDVIEVGQIGGFVDEIIDAATIKALCAEH